MEYSEFLERKSTPDNLHGFKPLWMPDFLFDFQSYLVDWAIRKGRGAVFADCGLGKSPMELVWAENVVRKTKGKVLLLTPIAVGQQMQQEAKKFGVKVIRSQDGNTDGNIVISNYERLHYFNPSDFSGLVLDESGILKNFNGVTKHKINLFVRKIKYRLLATATPSPNDFIELGTSSEALGYLGYMDMLGKFFKNDNNTCDIKRGGGRGFEVVKWRLKHHAHRSFWQWVTSWSRSVRYPSDLGFEDGAFLLPKLKEIEHELPISREDSNRLFTLPANGLKEVRDERRATIIPRCELAAERVNQTKSHAVVWCNLNAEGDLLTKLIPDAIQVSGSDKDDMKESKLVEFTKGNHMVLVTKPKIGAWGLNWQHCNHITFFPAYSYEQYYQAIRRCWRFGQKKPVTVDLIYTEGDKNAISNLRRKQKQADEMFTNLVKESQNSLSIKSISKFKNETEIPSWA